MGVQAAYNLSTREVETGVGGGLSSANCLGRLAEIGKFMVQGEALPQ